MTPPVAAAIPLYLTLRQLGLIDTHVGLILLYVGIGIPLAVWLVLYAINSKRNGGSRTDRRMPMVPDFLPNRHTLGARWDRYRHNIYFNLRLERIAPTSLPVRRSNDPGFANRRANIFCPKVYHCRSDAWLSKAIIQ